MSIGHAVALGVLQALGEFLPISSSGHLILVPWFLGWPAQGLAFDVALHFGTLLAVLWAFAADWWRLLTSFFRGLSQGRPFAEGDGRLLGYLAVASVPGAVAGLLLDEWAETVFRSPALVAASLALMGLGLLVADRLAKGGKKVGDVRLGHAVLIGCSQALAIVPGVSRSGATISMALLLGFDRDEAARFSFLMSTPIILGAVVYKAPHLLEAGNLVATLAGTLAAAVVGLAAIRFLLRYVKTHSYLPFVYYRWALAAVTVLVLLVRSA